ncbi:hypothetical protein CDL15_Pgr023460 [Punica granatum]|uniref:Uncharacterized protein n=1 Tax=Punica granatum TaxID=22663 RepID=A0A218W6W3_PUNGR|nr:hypothetical protein CDL15_Pgr023460 [Punica granatum]PKI68489.1 hypothetical protein CRG98_011127 [Punica granatum]
MSNQPVMQMMILAALPHLNAMRLLTKEQRMGQSLSYIQQLPRDFPDYSIRFTGKTKYHSYTNGEALFDSYGSNNYYASPDETYYHQQYQGSWNSQY